MISETDFTRGYRRIKQEYGISVGTFTKKKITFPYEHYIAQNIKMNYEFATVIQIYVKSNDTIYSNILSYSNTHLTF